MVTSTTPGGQRVTICTCTRTGRRLATFTRWPGSSLYTLATEPPQVAASAHVQNGIAERRIGLVMKVDRTSMIHAAAPHFLWPFAVRYAAHQLNLLPVSPCWRPRPHCVGRGRLAMHRCSGSRDLVPLFAIHPRTSSPPVLSPAIPDARG
ncbi:unnamed protein product [Closterium sp. NIES-54]